METKFESYKIVANHMNIKRRETERGARNLLDKLLKEGRKAWMYGVYFDENGYNEKLIAGSKVYHPVYEWVAGKQVLAENVEWR